MYKKLISSGDISSIREFLNKAETFLYKPKVNKDGSRSHSKVCNFTNFNTGNYLFLQKFIADGNHSQGVKKNPGSTYVSSDNQNRVERQDEISRNVVFSKYKNMLKNIMTQKRPSSIRK